MKKICLFIDSMNGGGAEKVFANLANFLSKNGFIVLLILQKKEGVYLSKINRDIYIYELKTKNLLFQSYKIAKICKQETIDLLISNIRFNNIIALISKIKYRLPVIIRESATLYNLTYDKSIFDFKSRVFLRLMKIFYPLADYIIANSKDTKEDLIKEIPSIENKIVVIHNPLINEDIFILGNEKIENKIFEKLSKPIIISAGRLHKIKNYAMLFNSFKIVSDKIPTSNLVILGIGSEYNHLIKLRNELKLSERIHFLGFVDNPFKYFKNSDLFIITSLSEGFGNVIVEALAMGLPVISTDCPGGPRDIIGKNEYGTLVHSKDISVLANAIIEKLNEKKDSMISVNRAKDFSINEIGIQYINVINKVI